MKDLITPREIKDVVYIDMKEALKDHCDPTPSVIISRFHFYLARQQHRQSIADFIAHLKKLAQHCTFGNTIDDMLRDLLVVGLADDRI